MPAATRTIKRGPAPSPEVLDAMPDEAVLAMVDERPDASPVNELRPVLEGSPPKVRTSKKSPERQTPAMVAKREKQNQRDAEALRLRKAGNDYASIGRQMGLSASGAHAAVKRALRNVNGLDATEFLTFELERLEGLYSIAYSALVHSVADTGGKDPHLGAMDRCLGIIAKKATLMGVTDARGNINVVFGDQNVAVDARDQQVVIAEGSKDAYIAALAAAREAVGGEKAGMVGEQPAIVYELAQPQAEVQPHTEEDEDEEQEP